MKKTMLNEEIVVAATDAALENARRPLPDVPAALDARILLAAAGRARRRRVHWLRATGLAAAAAVLLAFGGVWMLNAPEKLPAADPAALALWDWTGVEQNGYQMSLELYNGQAELATLAMR